MVARKTYTLTKKTYKKKKTYRKKRSSMPRSIPQNILQVRRIYNWTTLVPSTASVNGFWQYIGFQPINLPDFAQYANVFDMFKVNALKFTMYPRYTEVPIAGQPQVYATYVIDPQSLLTPTGTYTRATYNTLLEQGGVKIRSLNRPFSIYFRPKMADDINTSPSQKFINTWMSTTSGALIARGFHLFFSDANFSGAGFANVSVDVTITAYMQFKNIK